MRPKVVTHPPSLSPEKAVPVLEALVRESEEAAHSPGTTWWHDSRGALRAAFGEGHEITLQFDLSGRSFSDESQVRKRKVQEARVAVLQSAIKQLRWQLPDPHQLFLRAGSQHDAFVEIRKIVQQATRELFIVDPWVDHTLWPLLTNIPGSCRIRVLTENMKGDFILEGKRFAAQHGASLEVRRTTNYHDRFLILEGTKCFHLGASIKDAGNKAFALSELARASISQAAIADADAEWVKSVVVL